MLAVLVLASALLVAETASRARSDVRSTQATVAYKFPLRVAPSKRYLVDQANRPFLLVGDSPQALIGDLSTHDAAVYIANRRSYGIDALWVNLLCAKYTGCRSDAKTHDGIPPFTKSGDLSTPNPAYFARAESMVRLAAKADMVVFLDPIETGSWLATLRSNGLAKAYAYGQFLGRRFRSSPNIVWMHGNDFQTWKSDGDDELVLAVARGIRSVDKVHLQTVELNYLESGSLDDARWRPLIGIDCAYTYMPTYARVLEEYDRSSHIPVVMIEAGYEAEQNTSSISRGDPPILRRQEYWSMLSGAFGQFYGNHSTWQFIDGWQNQLNTTGSADLRRLVQLFADRPWYKLVPDRSHAFVVAGYGTFTDQGNVGSNDYVTAAVTSDGTLGMAYLPTRATITVDLSRLRRSVTGSWFDPTSGTFTPIPQAALDQGGRVQLTPPGANHAGDDDWVVVLSAH